MCVYCTHRLRTDYAAKIAPIACQHSMHADCPASRRRRSADLCPARQLGPAAPVVPPTRIGAVVPFTAAAESALDVVRADAAAEPQLAGHPRAAAQRDPR